MDVIPAILNGTAGIPYFVSRIRTHYIQTQEKEPYEKLLDKGYSHTGEDIIKAFCSIASCVVLVHHDATVFTYTPRAEPMRIVEIELTSSFQYQPIWKFQATEAPPLFYAMHPFKTKERQILLDFHIESCLLSSEERGRRMLDDYDAVLETAILVSLADFKTPNTTNEEFELACLAYLVEDVVTESVSVKMLKQFLQTFSQTSFKTTEKVKNYCEQRKKRFASLVKYTTFET